MHDLSKAALFPIDLLMAGIPCPDFSSSHNTGAGPTEEERWCGWDELVSTIALRMSRGILDQALLVENVKGFLAHVTPERLEQLRDQAGMHSKIFLAGAPLFGCATTRERIVLVAFRDPAHLAKFGRGPRPTSAEGVPLSAIIEPKYNAPLINAPLFLRTRELMHGVAAAHGTNVVSPATTQLMHVRTRANSPATPSGLGSTFICLHPSVAQQTEKLSEAQKEEFKTWFDGKRFGEQQEIEPIYRRLHPREELRAMGWRPEEQPGFAGRVDKRTYEWIADSLCPPAFEPFVARMMWALGKKLPSHVTVTEAAASNLEKKTGKLGVEYYVVKA